eukprot:9468242-Pyramimonas_sp.AAC.1
MQCSTPAWRPCVWQCPSGPAVFTGRAVFRSWLFMFFSQRPETACCLQALWCPRTSGCAQKGSTGPVVSTGLSCPGLTRRAAESQVTRELRDTKCWPGNRCGDDDDDGGGGATEAMTTTTTTTDRRRRRTDGPSYET